VCTRKIGLIDVILLLFIVTAITIIEFGVHCMLMLYHDVEGQPHTIFYGAVMVITSALQLRYIFPWHVYRKPMSEELRAKYYRIM
jgi:hypothetical protein